MPGDRNSIAYYVHTVLALRLPGVTVGYCLKFLHFMFSAKPLLGFQSQALTLQGKFEFHKSLKLIRCCLVASPQTCGEPGPAIRNKVKVSFLLDSFQGCFSWQTKPRIYD